MLKIAKAKFPALFAALAAQGVLYTPVKMEGVTNYAIWTEAAKVDLRNQTTRSAKDVFFPQVENVMDFEKAGLKLSLQQRMIPEQTTIIFGVRGCDAASFAILDKVFLKDPIDEFYKARREHGVIITLACSAPDETCFCHTYNIDATAPGGDITTWLVGDELYWQANTDKGKAITEKVQGTLEESDDKAVKEQQAATKVVMTKLPLANFKIDPKIIANKDMKVFNSKAWDQLSSTCLGCCACTYVCPTCHCYDVRDFEVDNKVERFRCWDSCMNKDFTKMAAVNPRPTQKERTRQRYMHKLVYFPENNEGTIACVGCGRCLQKCPVSLNIVKVEKALEVAKDV